MYGALAAPDVQIEGALAGSLNAHGLSQFSPANPYGQLAALQAHNWLILGVGLAFVLAGLALSFKVKGSMRTPLVAGLGLAGAGVLALGVAVNTLTGSWDEVFVFASQAQSFANGNLPGVPVTGSPGLAESSADAAASQAGGVLLALFPALRAETALVVSYIVSTCGVVLLTVALMRRWFGLDPLIGAATAAFTVILLPESLGALASGVPLILAAAGLVLLAVATAHAFRDGSPWVIVGAGIIASWIRWEYGLLALVGLAILSLRTLASKPKRIPVLRKQLVATASWFAFLVVVALIRVSLFGAAVPSGVRSKSVPLDGAYLANGIGYLDQLRDVTSWDVLLALLVSLLVLNPRIRWIKWPVAVVLLPLVTGVAAGGDWFPETWARYLVPSLAATATLVVIAIAIPKAPDGTIWHIRLLGKRVILRANVFFPAVVVVVVLVGSLPAAVNVLTSLQEHQALRQGNGRVDCLAAGGELLRLALPRGVGVATAEVNTIAFFSQQPLTDLSGLVDPRTARSPFSPLTPGDVMHRRANSAIIRSDRPGAIYLYEGVSCGSPSPSPAASRERWWDLLNVGHGSQPSQGLIGRFRAGAPQQLLVDYAPVVLEGPSVNLYVLVRRDLLPQMRAKGTFSYSGIAQ